MNEMKKYFRIALIAILAIHICSDISFASQPPYSDSMEDNIEAILKRLTLREKVGQMAQFTADVIMKGDNIYSSYEPIELDMDAVHQLLNEYKVGSILNTANNRARTPEQWQSIIRTLQKTALDATGIPLLYGIDSNHGASYTVGATYFPQAINMAASFNTLLMYEGSKISAYETRSCGIPWTFSPTMDLGREARWSRLWESFGEDPHVNAMMSVASVKGFQGEDHNKVGKYNISGCAKHYLGYGVPQSGKDRTPAIISESELREKFFEPFRASVVEGQVLSIMPSSGVVNGVSTHSDYRLLTEWLKEQLHFDGLIVSDWADVSNLYKRDKLTESYKEAIALAINAGVDMVMEAYDVAFCDLLLEAVEEGLVSMERINDAVRRVLRLKFRLGLFDTPIYPINDYPLFGSDQFANVAYNAAKESITLLKNEDNILPLKKGVKILLAGPNAHSMRTLNGGWSYSWQGEKVEEFASSYNTIYEALCSRFGDDNVLLEEGVSYDMDGQYYQEHKPEIDKAVKASEGVDVILLAIGENSYCETPGNLDELAISPNQVALDKALQATGKPVVLILNEGRPRIIREIEPSSKAIIHVYLPGNYGGDALADILLGRVNPSGKLPYTYPKYEQSLLTYDHKPNQNIDGEMSGAYNYGANSSIQYPFGYGLSYTTFDYTDLRVNKSDFDDTDILEVSVKVKNSGSVKGKESVLLYSRDLVASMTPDVKRLRAFQKVELEPGESITVSFKLPASDLAFVRPDGKWTLEKGSFHLMVGDEVLPIECTTTKVWDTPNR